MFRLKVVGTTYEGRYKILKSVAETIKSEEYYDKTRLYEGLKNKEILDTYDIGDKIFETEPLDIPYVKLELEPENLYDKNAIKVLIGNTKEEMFHIGYIPKENAVEIKNKVINTSNEDKYVLYGTILGGKYKTIEINEDDEEEVHIEKLDYSIWLEFHKPYIAEKKQEITNIKNLDEIVAKPVEKIINETSNDNTTLNTKRKDITQYTTNNTTDPSNKNIIEKINNLELLSFIFGYLSLFLSCICLGALFIAPGLVLGIISLVKYPNSKNRIFSISGIILSIIGFISVLFFAIYFGSK